MVISAPDFDTGEVGTKTIVLIPEQDAGGLERLSAAGLDVFEEGDVLRVDEPFPGTPYFEILANEYDFYADEPVQIISAEVPNDRMPKEIFFLPAFLLLGLICLIQRRRATQPAF